MTRQQLVEILNSMLGSVTVCIVANSQVNTVLSKYLGTSVEHGEVIEVQYAEDERYALVVKGNGFMHIPRYDDPVLDKLMEEGITWLVTLSPSDFVELDNLYMGEMEDRLRS
jgi:hypothetical protein